MAGPATAGLKLASDATYLHAKTEELTAAIDASRFVIQALELESGALASSIKGKWNEEYLVFMRWTHGLLLGSSCTTDFCGGNVYFFCLWKIYIHTPFVTKQKTEREWKMSQLSFVHVIRCPIDVICWKLNSRCRAVKWVQRDGLSNYKLHQKLKKKTNYKLSRLLSLETKRWKHKIIFMAKPEEMVFKANFFLSMETGDWQRTNSNWK